MNYNACGSYICYAVFTVSKKFAGIVYTHCIQIIRNSYVHFLFRQLTQMWFWKYERRLKYRQGFETV